jgi:uncharacterized protein
MGLPLNYSKIQTYSGGAIDLFSPKPEDVNLRDIAHSLALTNRYTGHSLHPYSVGAHSLHVSRLVRPELRRHALFHDAEEAYLGDWSTILKKVMRALGMGWAMSLLTKRFTKAIRTKFNLRELTEEEEAEIKWADRAALTVEHRVLMLQVDNSDFYWPFVEWDSIPPEEQDIQHGDWSYIEFRFRIEAGTP